MGNSNLSSLRARVEDANSWGAEYFISLHTNASSNPDARGTEAFIYSAPSESERLADSILEQINLTTGIPNRGTIVRPGLYVLRKTRMPAVLVELGFITNPYEARLMAESPEIFASAVADGVTDFLRSEATESFSFTEEEIPEDDWKITDYDTFIEEHPLFGSLKIQAYRARMAFPVPGVKVIISKEFSDGERVFFEGTTDENGIIDGIRLPAPPRGNSLEYLLPDKAATYVLRTESPDYVTILRQFEIFENTKTIQPLSMILGR